MPRRFDVQFANQKVPTPTSLTLLEELGSHQIAVLGFQTHTYAHKFLYEGDPVDIRWGERRAPLRGYINHIDTNSLDRENAASTLAYCLGPSRPLKSAQQNSWQNASLRQIVNTVARKEFLASEVEDDYRVFSSLQQPGDISSWEFLRNHAERAGLALHTEGGVVVMRSLRHIKPSPETPILSPLEDSFRPVLHAQITRGQASPHGGRLALRTGFGVNDQGGEFGARRVEATFQEFADYPIHTSHQRSDLERDLSRDYRRNALTQYAEVTVAGSALFRPMRHVFLNGYGDPLDGYWLITRSRHIIDDTQHVSSLKLLRSGDEPKAPPSRIPERRVPENPLRFVNGRWVVV